ncbi:unnamed protein product [Didymodactylos carnosus]|uniref:Tyr recombinase domain-containing protein n=1 Tax=Didymodactylos carnosus TaxID=1234261 RepID=A0A8S2PMB8_9BILA|nr:unnamed protein product [Didymodactylos carnosus]CAF4053512.1 unnamed protein product [Didymodactylos carnosus]
MSTYLAFRTKLKLPSKALFILPDGSILDRYLLINHLTRLLDSLGYNPLHYSGHSFRIGAATSAARARVPTYLIKLLGRWSTESYRRYFAVSPSCVIEALRKIITSKRS